MLTSSSSIKWTGKQGNAGHVPNTENKTWSVNDECLILAIDLIVLKFCAVSFLKRFPF